MNGLYSDRFAGAINGDIGMDGLVDGGVGVAQEDLNTYDCTETDDLTPTGECDPDPLVLVHEGTLFTTDLPEDDGCPNGDTTDPTTQAECVAGGDDGDFDAFFVLAVDISDLLGNTLSDGEGDQLMIDDKFEASLAFGTDRGDPEFDEDEFAPPLDDPPFIWNPDCNVGGGACADLDPAGFETIMFEADDPDLASGDAGSGLEDDNCGVECDDVDGEGSYIHGRILNAPDADDEFDPDDGDDIGDPGVIPADNIGLGADMFALPICQVVGQFQGFCDTATDGSYTVEIEVSDHAVWLNNIALFELDFILDVTPPEVTFDGITGLDTSNAAEVGLTLFGAVSDATPLSVAEIAVTVDSGGAGDCPGNLVNQEDNLVEPSDNDPDEPVVVDILDILGDTGGEYAVDFTAGNLNDAFGYTLVTYCFEVTADDGAARKNGDDDEVETVSIATKQFEWF